MPLISLALALIGGLLLALDLSLKSPSSAAPEGSSLPEIDGAIAEGEYAHSYHDETTGIDLYWTASGDQICFALRSPGKGWVALALSPTGPMMQGGDIIIGYVSQEGPQIHDEYADSPMSHKADTELGGRDDILEAAGSATEGTVIEFCRKLDTGDPYDKPVVAGEMELQLAYSDKADLTSYHAKRSSVKLQLLGG